ncbi:hypothetical protein [Mucilaginibacter pedocola]|uniref:Uncharacterized protein n=1 Tax=Mucilaginibacter pedocola TaxID=1792845 RepID=A0A1S9PAV9_9SPHI|nr:hypothetical protein [Mucilaginibacter pedocola]OOQ57947.1 hypothetical protein BC343_09725 [Mucilaginibacter pedocola]
MMGEKFSLPIAQGLFVQLAKGQINIAEFLKQLFGEPGTHNYWLMCEGLVAYHNKDGGSPEVKHFDITDSGFNADTKTGFCKCSFGIHFHYLLGRASQCQRHHPLGF